MAPLKVGIIGANATGAGWAARAHLPAFKAGIPGVELAAVCTSRQESAEEAGKMFGVPAYWDHRKMLSEADIDAVAVVVKLPHHYELAKDVIAASKHIYVEWPLCTTTAEAEEIRDLASKAGVATAIGLQSRHAAEYATIRKLIDDGFVGRVLSVSSAQFMSGAWGRPAARLWMGDAEAAANTLTITFGHALNGLTTALGPLSSLSSTISTQTKQWVNTDSGEVRPVTAPDNVAIVGSLASGATLSVHVAQVPRQSTGHGLDIIGSDGTLRLDGYASTSPSRLTGATGDTKEFSELSVAQDDWVTEKGLQGSAINIGKLWKAFGESIASGTSFDPDFTFAVEHHKLVDAVRRSFTNGERVEL